MPGGEWIVRNLHQFVVAFLETPAHPMTVGLHHRGDVLQKFGDSFGFGLWYHVATPCREGVQIWPGLSARPCLRLLPSLCMVLRLLPPSAPCSVQRATPALAEPPPEDGLRRCTPRTEPVLQPAVAALPPEALSS